MKFLNTLILCLVLTANVIGSLLEEISTLMMVRKMTLEEKIGQLFIVRPEVMDSLDRDAYQPGGYCLFAKNIQDSVQLAEYVKFLGRQNYFPLICVDEEGGRVARIAGSEGFDVPRFRDMQYVARGGAEAVEDAAYAIGRYLRHFGFDLDFAPVADVNTNSKNFVIGTRAFSDDPDKAAEAVVAYMKGLSHAGVASCLKHFPGHGDTSSDSHEGYVESHKSLEELGSCEFKPFKAGIAAGVPMVMTGHISLPEILGDSTPATLSAQMVSILRNDLGFKGIIITDAMEMGAISKTMDSAQAALAAVMAGVDIVLLPKDYKQAFDALEEACLDGRISRGRLDGSVVRILRLKRKLGKFN